MERLILIGIGGLLTGFGVDWGLPAATWLLAVLTVITVVQRLVHVRRQELHASAPAVLRADGAGAGMSERSEAAA